MRGRVDTSRLENRNPDQPSEAKARTPHICENDLGWFDIRDLGAVLDHEESPCPAPHAIHCTSVAGSSARRRQVSARWDESIALAMFMKPAPPLRHRTSPRLNFWSWPLRLMPSNIASSCATSPARPIATSLAVNVARSETARSGAARPCPVIRRD
jgi:hypothetical protein